MKWISGWRQSENIWAILPQRLNEADFQIAPNQEQISNGAEVLEPATLPKRSIKSNKVVMIAVGVLIGLAIGLILFFISVLINRRKTQQERRDASPAQPIAVK